MSALAVQSRSPISRRGVVLSELQALSLVSRAVSRAKDFLDGLEASMDVALQVAGVFYIEVVPDVALPGNEGRKILRFGVPSAESTAAVLIAPVSSGGKRFAELRLSTRIDGESLANPLQFARFLGQQTGVLWNIHEASLEQQELRRKLKIFNALVRRRKAIHRARALLRHSHNLSDDQALLLLRRYARQSGRSILQIAEAIVFSERQQRQSIPESRSERRKRALASPHRVRRLSQSPR